MSELYILMLSIHGLIRGHDLELGREADTGGQVLYVVELARSLARQHQIAKVDLVTRRIEDPAVSTDYAQPEESLGSEARIVRLRCGPRRYLRKESLWPYLDHMVDHALLFLREQKRLPDVIHSHYADAGYVGMQLSQLLGIPQIHTGHSLGRTLDSALKVLSEWGVPLPDVLITAVGSEINYGRELRPDVGWQNLIKHLWRRDALQDALRKVPGLTLQADENQREFKLSSDADPGRMPSVTKIRAILREQNLSANLIYSHQAYLDVLPLRASKGRAIRYLAYKWGLPLNAFLVAGDSGNDHEMLVGDTLGVIVANHSPELASLKGNEQIYFARAGYADGIAEGMAHYEFGTSIMETANDTQI